MWLSHFLKRWQYPCDNRTDLADSDVFVQFMDPKDGRNLKSFYALTARRSDTMPFLVPHVPRYIAVYVVTS